MIIDDKLTWNSHINYLLGQLVKYTGIFKLISKLIPHSCKRQLYFANIYSRVQHGNEVYGQASTGQLKKIQVMQNCTIKVLYNLDRLMPTNNLHRDLSILTEIHIQTTISKICVQVNRKLSSLHFHKVLYNKCISTQVQN